LGSCGDRVVLRVHQELLKYKKNIKKKGLRLVKQINK
jgi:hypothetical protein